MSEPEIVLSPEQAEALESFVEQFPARDRSRTQAWMLAGRITMGAQEEPGGTIRGMVEHYGRHAVELRFLERQGWSSRCTCRQGLDCVHGLALASLAWPLTVVDPELQASSGGQAKARKPAKAARKSDKTSKPRPLLDALTAVLGTPPNRDQVRFVEKIEELHRRVATRKAISAAELHSLQHGAPLPDVEHPRFGKPHSIPVQLESVLDFWLYLTDERAIPGFSPPHYMAPLRQALRPGPELVAHRRQLEVKAWQEALAHEQARARALETPSAAVPIPVQEVRVVLAPDQPELHRRDSSDQPWKRVAPSRVDGMIQKYLEREWAVPASAEHAWNTVVALWQRQWQRGLSPFDPYHGAGDGHHLLRLVDRLPHGPEVDALVHSAAGVPLLRPQGQVRWSLTPPGDGADDYQLEAFTPDGQPVGEMLAEDNEGIGLVLTHTTLWRAPRRPGRLSYAGPNRVPVAVVESAAGMRLLAMLGIPVPERVRPRVRTLELRVVLRAEVLPRSLRVGPHDRLRLTADAVDAEGRTVERLLEDGWRPSAFFKTGPDELVDIDRSRLGPAARHIGTLGAVWDLYCSGWVARVEPGFPERFSAWLRALPEGVEVVVCPELEGLQRDPLRAKVSLECTPVGVDWFDLSLAFDTGGETFTPEEIRLLLGARGGFARLEGKGWRRLEWNLDEEQERRLARLGLDARDLDPTPQRVHALQLADEATASFLAAEQAEAIRRRAGEIRARVAPAIPDGLRAGLRPYQVEGYHFLAYLSENSFGGVLADDMGLGKTLQTLAWIAWLRQRAGTSGPGRVLIVCPKSVVPNWKSEAGRFLPGLRVTAWSGDTASDFESVVAGCDALVVNYAQLRLLAGPIASVEWLAAIADEAQAVKNPDSLAAKALRAVKASHRLALTGTPIENHLLDLWSLMAFAMPGALGPRAEFQRRFGRSADAHARQRLASRLRPFLLRRTKSQVAQDLPPRIEEDLHCEMEGVQATLYRAELKRARAMLGRIRTSAELDSMRFHFLTSLLRLRQICCHPALVDPAHRDEPSAKVEALLDVLGPLVEEGQKVLVFSQFVGMLDLLRDTVQARGWKDFLLTGATEDRGPLVDSFNAHEGPAVFLISLKAGGAGLNLASASYVVLFDPWWNPAVEAQAIDRTHRIGQRNTVIAYRLLVKDSIEDKIRTLQKQKRLLADDVLGEERFSQGLTLDDLRVLFDGPDSE